MCGIAGIIGHDASVEELGIMLNRQQHRGPDFTGKYLDSEYVALGHNRLSIIDLSPQAHQPFSDASERYHLSFNGEIYNYRELRDELKANYRFKTVSDTEVLLASFIVWGKECLGKLNGMFSFVIWDSDEKKLFAARDRFGVKPFYYSLKKGKLYFSSEIKALQAVLKLNHPNEEVWANYFVYGSYGMPYETFFEGVDQLPGGHFMEFENSKINIARYYNFPRRISETRAEHSFEEAKEEYLELLKDSIKIRFRADVSIGFNLSGGVDSSLLLALVNLFEDKQHIKAYTFYTGDARYDELPWVEQMIATTRNPLVKVKFTAKNALSSLVDLSKVQDEPFGGIPTMAYASLFRQAGEDGVKVLLDGQGMDEQWAGYDYYQNPGSSNIQGTGNKTPFRPGVLNWEFMGQVQNPEYPKPFDNRLQNLQYRDLFYTKIPRALCFNDRISMAYSTELREPFLDYRLVEFAFAQPDIYKIRNNTGKYLLREILSELAPKELSYTPKRPLQTPQREWFGDELKSVPEAAIEILKNSKISSWFDFKEMEKEWKRYQAGDNQSSFHIWQWVNASLMFKG